ncbi:SRPBCC domain-containing protein [Dyadobacter sp. NIV53]|uniref:SRPBCC family protein n=1 Tax=Dyadobacter sp. NIV53 TaxID=2861765 RepID=UPI001C88A21E|nr:SRPBCC domain-containing protein [Dyadobacter sp. NIV53]
MDAKPIIVERTLNAPVDRVWQALTDRTKMKEWYFDINDFKPEKGFEFQFYGGSEDEKYLHLCKITDVIEHKKISYTWRYDNYPGNSELTFELFEEGNKTRLVLTHTGLESFPKNKTDFAKESFAEGWDFIINISLPEFLEKEEVVN